MPEFEDVQKQLVDGLARAAKLLVKSLDKIEEQSNRCNGSLEKHLRDDLVVVAKTLGYVTQTLRAAASGAPAAPNDADVDKALKALTNVGP